jgi:hypothetical protein
MALSTRDRAHCDGAAPGKQRLGGTRRGATQNKDGGESRACRGSTRVRGLGTGCCQAVRPGPAPTGATYPAARLPEMREQGAGVPSCSYETRGARSGANRPTRAPNRRCRRRRRLADPAVRAARGAACRHGSRRVGLRMTGRVRASAVLPGPRCRQPASHPLLLGRCVCARVRACVRRR